MNVREDKLPEHVLSVAFVSIPPTVVRQWSDLSASVVSLVKRYTDQRGASFVYARGGNALHYLPREAESGDIFEGDSTAENKSIEKALPILSIQGKSERKEEWCD
jgi:hypothetical protein